MGSSGNKSGKNNKHTKHIAGINRKKAFDETARSFVWIVRRIGEQFIKSITELLYKNKYCEIEDIYKYSHMIPFLYEIYCICFHQFVVKVWIIANLLCNLLQMYADLNDLDEKKRLLPICADDIKNISKLIIGCGFALIVFHIGTIGWSTIFLIFHLINRTMRNIFNMGL